MFNSASAISLTWAKGLQFAVVIGQGLVLPDLPFQDDLFVALAEQGLDRELFLAAAHDVGRGFLVEQQHDGVDENGFSGPGLAGQDIQFRRKVQLNFFHHGQVFDFEIGKHQLASIGDMGEIQAVMRSPCLENIRETSLNVNGSILPKMLYWQG